MSGPRARYTKRYPPRSASPVLNAIFREAMARNVKLIDLAAAVDKHEARLSEYKRGRVEPGILTVEEMAGALGFRLVLAPIVERDR